MPCAGLHASGVAPVCEALQTLGHSMYQHLYNRARLEQLFAACCKELCDTMRSGCYLAGLEPCTCRALLAGPAPRSCPCYGVHSF
jgi:hypothetical protein